MRIKEAATLLNFHVYTIYSIAVFFAVKEVNLAFLPIEERVFSLDNPDSYKQYYGETPMSDEAMDRIAEQLVFLLILAPAYIYIYI